PAELVRRAAADLVVVSVAPEANPGVIEDAVASGGTVLAETPPAVSADALRALWHAVGAARRVQVAEQYPLLPGHAARREVVRRGLIGAPTSVQVSSTHGYHAVSLIRAILGAGFGPVTVRASRRAEHL